MLMEEVEEEDDEQEDDERGWCDRDKLANGLQT
jgi:hypothetical protein